MHALLPHHNLTGGECGIVAELIILLRYGILLIFHRTLEWHKECTHDKIMDHEQGILVWNMVFSDKIHTIRLNDELIGKISLYLCVTGIGGRGSHSQKSEQPNKSTRKRNSDHSHCKETKSVKEGIAFMQCTVLVNSKAVILQSFFSFVEIGSWLHLWHLFRHGIILIVQSQVRLTLGQCRDDSTNVWPTLGQPTLLSGICQMISRSNIHTACYYILSYVSIYLYRWDYLYKENQYDFIPVLR